MDFDCSSKKRKTLHDYFGASGKTEKSVASHDASKRAKTTQVTGTIPAGLRVLNDFITRDEETQILAFLDKQTWRTDLVRRTMHYGGTYCLMPPRDASPNTRRQIEQTILTAPSMPEQLAFLIARMIDHGLYDLHAKPEYCIVNEYLPGQGISAHVENFRFGEPVCSLTLAGDDMMRFHELESAHDGSVRSGKASTAPRTGRRSDVQLPRRSLVVLTGDARSKWQHEIVRGRTKSKPHGWRRVSLTFRVEKKS